jgi:predicted site-specific integrase-resolvase
MKFSAYAKQLGIHYDTAYRTWQRGEIVGYQVPSGTIIVEAPALAPTPRPQKVAVYTRVSSAENRRNLEGQAERVVAFCAARGWQVSKVVKECGSGVNDQRPLFLGLLADTNTTHIVAASSDRCSRFDVASIQTILKAQSRELVIVNEADNGRDDLMQDLVSILTSFTARLYGRRRATRKQSQLLAVLQEEGGES